MKDVLEMVCGNINYNLTRRVHCREHVTVRLTPDGKNVVGVYYSAHR